MTATQLEMPLQPELPLRIPAAPRKRDYMHRGCALLLGAILQGTRPKHELLPPLTSLLRTAMSLDNLLAMTPAQAVAEAVELGAARRQNDPDQLILQLILQLL